MKSLFAAALVGTISASTINHIKIAEAYNHHRSGCNLATDLPDGISQRKKDMTTQSRYKSMLLADCEGLIDTDRKLTCIQGNVWLKTGKVNYVNYVGARRQSNTCKKLKNIPVCATMCKEFFQFWHEPIPGSCALVKAEWKQECEWRVQLIAEKKAEQFDLAAITQDKLDGLFPDLEAVYEPVAPVLHEPVVVVPDVEVNPWLLNKHGVYDMLDPEIKRLNDEFNAKDTQETKCALLGGYHDEKFKDLKNGHAQGDVLIEAKNWHESREDREDEYALFLNRNDRKTVALSRLRVQKCLLGNEVCYDRNDACDALKAFYANQRTSIQALRHVNEGVIGDYESAMSSDLENSKTKAMWQQKITGNRDALRTYIAECAKNFEGEAQAQKVTEATNNVRNMNSKLWAQYLRGEKRQMYLQGKLFEENDRVNKLIAALINKGKGQEEALIANLI